MENIGTRKLVTEKYGGRYVQGMPLNTATSTRVSNTSEKASKRSLSLTVRLGELCPCKFEVST